MNELYSIVDDGYTSEQELNTRKLVTNMNKKKRSGGFQSMGTCFLIFNFYFLFNSIVIFNCYKCKFIILFSNFRTYSECV